MSWTDEIINFLEDYTCAKEIQPDSDLFGKFGIVGDDFHEMIEKYAQNYQVDMSSYLWFFHCDEEGQSFGGILFKPPYSRVDRIPVTPSLLASFLTTKKWDINYPPYILPQRRYDLIINKLIVVVFVLMLIVLAFNKYIYPIFPF
jgi:hypothetical protein